MRIAILALLVLGLLLSAAVYYFFFAEDVYADFHVTSPDGTLRATIRGWGGRLPQGGWGIQAWAVIERSANKRWEVVKREQLEVDDSASAPNYTVEWQNDAKGQVKSIKISGANMLHNDQVVEIGN